LDGALVRSVKAGIRSKRSGSRFNSDDAGNPAYSALFARAKTAAPSVIVVPRNFRRVTP